MFLASARLANCGREEKRWRRGARHASDGGGKGRGGVRGRGGGGNDRWQTGAEGGGVGGGWSQWRRHGEAVESNRTNDFDMIHRRIGSGCRWRWLFVVAAVEVAKMIVAADDIGQ